MIGNAGRQRGVTLFGLLFWAVIVGFGALIGMRVLPAVNEYFTIKRTVNKIATEGSTVADIRTAFDRKKDIEYSIESPFGAGRHRVSIAPGIVAKSYSGGMP